MITKSSGSGGSGNMFSSMLPHFGFDQKYAIIGCIGGLTLGLAVELPALIAAVARWDWNRIVEEAEEDDDEQDCYGVSAVGNDDQANEL